MSVARLDAFERRLPRRSLARALLRLWTDRLTPGGRALCGVAAVAGGGAAGFGISYPIHYLAMFLVSLLLVNQLTGWLFRPRVRVDRRLPARCAAGAAVRVRARLTNVGALPALDLAVRELAEPAGLRATPSLPLARLARGASAEVDYTLRPALRGAYDLPGPQAFTTFPFGLNRTARLVPAPHRLLVTPRFVPLARLELPVSVKHQPGGLALVSRVGESEEFVGSREYRPGDRLRDLDHRAWARVGVPVVREFQQEYLSRIALLVDTHVGQARLGGAERLRALEAGVSLGAAVADALSRQEYVVDLFAAGPELYHFQAGRALAFLDDVLDVLACVEPCPADPFPTLGPAVLEAIGQLSTAVLVLLDWDASRRELARRLAEHGVATRVVVVRAGPTTLDPAGFAGGAGPITLLTPAQVEGGVGAL